MKIDVIHCALRKGESVTNAMNKNIKGIKGRVISFEHYYAHHPKQPNVVMVWYQKEMGDG